MHGNLAPLDTITRLAEKYNAKLMVDDTHGLGIVGPIGRRTASYFNVINKIDLHVGMLSKVPTGIGGFCAISRKLFNICGFMLELIFFNSLTNSDYC